MPKKYLGQYVQNVLKFVAGLFILKKKRLAGYRLLENRRCLNMRFFIDTAKVEDIRKANDMGVICGVTTNPSLIAKEGRVFELSLIHI